MSKIKYIALNHKKEFCYLCEEVQRESSLVKIEKYETTKHDRDLFLCEECFEKYNFLKEYEGFSNPHKYLEKSFISSRIKNLKDNEIKMQTTVISRRDLEDKFGINLKRLNDYEELIG